MDREEIQMELGEKLNWLIDQWCDRRELKLLQQLLPIYLGPEIQGDQPGRLLKPLREIRDRCREQLTEEERELVASAIVDAETLLHP